MPDPLPADSPSIYDGARRFAVTALVQASDLSPSSARYPSLPWSLAYIDEVDQERFYLTNTDLIRELAQLLNKLRALPTEGAIPHQMLNQGFPCYLYVQRQGPSVLVNVTAYRDGRDRLLKEDIVMSWEELVALLTLSVRHFLTEFTLDYPALRSPIGPLIEAFNQWAAKWQLVPFQPPAASEESLATAQTSARDRKRRAPLAAPVYLNEWRNHKDRNLRLNTALIVTYIALFFVSMLPLNKLPLGLWIFPALAIGLPWFLVTRYPAIPLHSPLWTERGVRFRAFFPDTVLLLSLILVWIAANLQHANVVWLWLWPVGWLLCLFAGLGFPITHWARPIWDWNRTMLVSSLLVTTVILWLLADLGSVFAASLAQDMAMEPPPTVEVRRPAQRAVQAWNNATLKQVAEPIAWVIDEYTARRALHEFFPNDAPARPVLGGLLRWLWLGGVLAYGLGLYWAQLPSPTQVRVRTTAL